MRRINPKPVLVVAAAGALLAGAVVLTHRVQVDRMAGRLRARAVAAEAAGRDQEALDAFEKVLALQPGDDPARARLAWLLDRTAHSRAEKARAATAFERALRRGPGQADVRRRLAALQTELGRYAEARTHLKLLISSMSGDAGLEEMMGRCVEAGGDPASAAGWYERALGRDPKRLGAALGLAALRRRRLGDPEGADRAVDALVGADPGSFAVWLGRARYRRAYGLPGVDDDLKEARELAPDQPDLLFEEALSARRRPDVGEARAVLDRGQARYPGDPRFPRERADLELADGRPIEAENALRRGLDALPGEAGLRWALANLLAERGDPAGLAEQLDRLRLDAEAAGYPPAALDYLAAWLAVHQGRWLDAVGVLERVEPLLASWPELRLRAGLLRARCYGQLGRVDREAETYRRLLDLGALPDVLAAASRLEVLDRPGLAEPLYRASAARPEGQLAFAGFLARRGRVSEALDVCERAWATCRAEEVAQATVAVLDTAPDDAEALDRAARRLDAAALKGPRSTALATSLASVRELQGRFADAERLYRQALESGDPVALNNLALLIALRGGDSLESLRLVNQAIDQAGPRPELLDTRGLVRLCAGDTAGAVVDLTSASALDRPGLAGLIAFHLAQAHLRADDRPAACSAFRKAMALGFESRALHPLERPAYRQVVAELGPGRM